ncbi:MAG: hypothetical protein WB721_16745, partial [Pseudolabrys sp.]
MTGPLAPGRYLSTTLAHDSSVGAEPSTLPGQTLRANLEHFLEFAQYFLARGFDLLRRSQIVSSQS